MANGSLEGLTKEQLYERAKAEDIPGRSQMDKDALLSALRRGSDGGRSGDGRKRADGGEARAGERSADRPSTTKRSVWKGAITFGLITIPVGLYTAVEDRDISFRLLSAKDQSRIRYKRVSAETGEEVGWEDIVKGFEYEKGHFVTFTREELEQIPSDSLRTIDVVQFIDADRIDPVFFARSYFVAPDPNAVKAYAVLTRALAESNRIGLAKVTIREKERLCALRASGDVIVLETMNWPDEIRIPDFEQLDSLPHVSGEELDMARMLIDRLTGEFDPTRFHDTYRERLEEAIQTKIEGGEVRLAPEEPQPEKVTDLLEALRASVAATQERRSA